MGVVTVRNIAIGQGIPKICIPIVAPAREGILKEAKSLLSLPCDLVTGMRIFSRKEQAGFWLI